MTPLFDSPTPILYWLSVEIFRLSLTVQTLLVCIYLAGNLASRYQNLEFSGALTPKCNFLSTQPPKRHFLTANRVVWAIVRVNRLSRFCCWRLHEEEGKVRSGIRYSKTSFCSYISPISGATCSQPIPTSFGTSRDFADVINHAKFHLDRLRGFGWAGAWKSHVSRGKRGRP
jgi:hypothetical protein